MGTGLGFDGVSGVAFLPFAVAYRLEHTLLTNIFSVSTHTGCIPPVGPPPTRSIMCNRRASPNTRTRE